MVNYYITLFIVALVSTWWIFKKVLKIAMMKNIVDNPDARKLQKTPVPVLGAAVTGVVVIGAASTLTPVTAAKAFSICDFKLCNSFCKLLICELYEDALELSFAATALL